MKSGSPILLLLIMLALVAVGLSLAGTNSQDSSYTMTTTTTASRDCGYGFTKTVKIVDNSFGTDAYIALYYFENGTLADFQVRYDYGRPRPSSGMIGIIIAYIDGHIIYNNTATDRIDIPSQFEDGKQHQVTVIYKCR